jgi:hypothetical protein
MSSNQRAELKKKCLVKKTSEDILAEEIEAVQAKKPCCATKAPTVVSKKI